MDISDTLLHIFNLLFLASAIHGVFLAFLCWRVHRFPLYKKYIIPVLILSVLWILNYLLFTTGWIKDIPHLLNVIIPWLYLTGPLIYL